MSRSSCESEYRAMTNTIAEHIWIIHLSRDLNALPPDRPTILCDNLSAIFLSHNPVAHRRANHIDIDYHFIRELVLAGKHHTKFVPTELHVDDIFTKPLPRPLCESFRECLWVGLAPISFKGRGGNRLYLLNIVNPLTYDIIVYAFVLLIYVILCNYIFEFFMLINLFW